MFIECEEYEREREGRERDRERKKGVSQRILRGRWTGWCGWW
jgi:hypothetical protein